jgi:hypothetical protein
MLDYIKDMDIDETALDVELLEQAELERKYLTALEDLRRSLEKEEENFELVESELILEANKLDDEDVFNKKKATQNDIHAWCVTQERYKEAKIKLNEIKSDYEYLKIAVNRVVYTRKSVLELLVKLSGQMYFSGPSTPRDISNERNKRKQTMSSISKKLNN